ncbi:MAG: maleylacetate reductase [Novosphingobium sp.]
MQREFVYQTHPGRVVFGAGSVRKLPGELAERSLSRALVLSTPGQAGKAGEISRMLGSASAGICDLATMHTPVEVTKKALDVLRATDADCLVSFGGGTAVGLGKALSARTGLAHVALPTTYAGSEMTPILGETENGVKTTRRDPAILPGLVIYDVELTLGLPAPVSATSGINAIAHAVEALYAPDRNPVISLMAEESIASLAHALPRISDNPADLGAREEALYGAWLAGTCLGAVSMAIHHKLCHTLGGTFGLPHAETHTVVLPYAMAYVADAAPQAMQIVARALGEKNAALGIRRLAHSLGAPVSLSAIGMPQSGLDRAADLAMKNTYWNPRPLIRDEIRALLGRAYEGLEPV